MQTLNQFGRAESHVKKQGMDEEDARHATVLFDGVCNLCNGTVLFLIDKDGAGYFKFAALQSDEGRRLLARHSYDDADLSSMVLIEDGQLFTRSTAALRIMRRLPLPWRLLSGLMIVPRPLRDVGYNFIARRRYRWFGKEDACRVPTPELRQRFL